MVGFPVKLFKTRLVTITSIITSLNTALLNDVYIPLLNHSDRKSHGWRNCILDKRIESQHKDLQSELIRLSQTLMYAVNNDIRCTHYFSFWGATTSTTFNVPQKLSHCILHEVWAINGHKSACIQLTGCIICMHNPSDKTVQRILHKGTP